ncbi:mite allergen Eur m 3-like [Cloeon dipterum]|uniref:mite allergen Eur m 3-like n=1 Tax=Cloeon dipterum TaxID=197152 RepID=UPI0032207865
MSSLQWLLCLALLAQCARAKSYGIRGTIELVNHSGKEIVEFAAEEQFKDTKSPDDNTDSKDDFSYNEAETQHFLAEALRDHNVLDTELKRGTASKNEISCSSGNETIVNQEPRSNLNYTQQLERILGGTDVADGVNVLFTYNVLVEGLSIFGTINKYCGGAILSKFWVLTAAQCVVGVAPVKVYAGSANNPIGGVDAIIATPYIHPDYILNTLKNDIALLRLIKPLALGAKISTISLASISVNTLSGVELRTYGWGPEDDSTVLPDPLILHYVDLKNVLKTTCQTLTQETYVTYPGNTGCLSTSFATHGICHADAGGPVTYIDEIAETEKVIGIDSYHFDCPSLYPSAFTLVLPYLNWIKLTTKLTFT